MTTVSTKQELISAIERREKQIIATGEIAASIRKKVKVKKSAKVGGLVLAIGGLLAIPFTGGASAGLTAAGMALTVGTVTVSTAELAILCGFVLAYKAIGNSKVEFMPNGHVIITPQYKD
ncbi:MAG: hypothetical protein PUH82_02295 [Bacteroidales bacterium]|nr:hypothetical protein [Bacteroidales bacterium]